MRIGFNIPNFAEFADPATAVSIAVEAERAGWDGVFIWDHINIFGEMQVPVADPWILLAAMAQATRRIAIGPMVTPVPRRRPWVLARQTVTLDRLSGGRLVMGVGLGIPAETEFAAFGEETDLRVRAEKLDEGLEILSGLWSGAPFEHTGRHYRVARTCFQPTPVQQPRPKIIVAGTWPVPAPLRRAARWDGYFPLRLRPDGEADPLTVEDIRRMKAQLEELRDGRPAEIVVSEEATGEPLDTDRLEALAAAGATWFMDGLGTRKMSLDGVFERIEKGPPALVASAR
jgi:alkanesulfonate monooxygenase SsuD/methylene tetrahydromethanopterin reductase-like flavin-dependent oxidoreductase (luciferase family)